MGGEGQATLRSRASKSKLAPVPTPVSLSWSSGSPTGFWVLHNKRSGRTYSRNYYPFKIFPFSDWLKPHSQFTILSCCWPNTNDFKSFVLLKPKVQLQCFNLFPRVLSRSRGRERTLGKRLSPLKRMYGLLTKCEVKMAGYWPSSFFACLWTETNINSQKNNEANIQPSWPNKLGQ